MNPQALIFERLKKVIVEQLEVDPNCVRPQANFANDLNANESDSVELLMAVEEEFDIDLPDRFNEEVSTVQQAVDYLYTHFPALGKEAFQELQSLVEPIADFWMKLEISEEEAISLTQKAFSVIKDREVASRQKELSELRSKLNAAKAEVESIEARIEQCEKNIE
jgi:acyl carrier protein